MFVNIYWVVNASSQYYQLLKNKMTHVEKDQEASYLDVTILLRRFHLTVL